jgi:imidazolonepropionase-like amidohydrolase
VRNGLIAAVGRDLPAQANAVRIDGAEKTLLPGLIDSHVHVFGDGPRDALRFGVTTELDMFCDRRRLAAMKRDRESLTRQETADLWSAGTAATAAGGHGTQYGLAIPTLASPAEAHAWVAARVGEGSDYIKIILEDARAYGGKTLPTLDMPTAAALIEAAHEHGVLAVVHATALELARRAVDAGADGLMHVFFDKPADQSFVRLAVAHRLFVVPTLTMIAGIAAEANGVALDTRVAPWLSDEQLGSLTRKRSPHAASSAAITNARGSVRRLHEAGVPILAGTDAPNANTAHGVSLHDEIAQLVIAGLSADQALAAATSRPADAFALHDRGRIAKGKRADLLLVVGDPTRDVTVTRAIAALWKNGRFVERAPLAADTMRRSAALGGKL